MSRTRNGLFVVLVLGSPFQSGVSAAASAERLVFKVVDSYSLLGAGPGRAAAEEVAHVFARIGVEVDWSAPTTTALPDPEQAELLVYLRPNRPEALGLHENVLGAVMSDRTPQRVLFLFMPAIAKTVGIKLDGGLRSADADRNLARAVARVIVHEAFHAIAPKLPHAETGLTSANLTRDALLQGNAGIALDASHVFRRELAALWRQRRRRQTPGTRERVPMAR